ncbi:hypothetical protein SAMN05216490_4173 [Mucilaginibacter mallensis]|uniref:CarboxypepD_reg-like domain-containing protein n=1 Tax=Mucilaginibacter mallensis TaxID=652787 RepID=A0A1H2BKZ0_MUCMA|nr:hypothetical protein [Mucilaginibacter mallensis]SDT58569.1 hypothetical protein SAMN05216490_4173 [Mucilaginibacter mallensis]
MYGTIFKYMLTAIILFCLITQAGLAGAQSPNITGMVTGTNERLSGAIIKDITRHRQIASDPRGMFSIAAQKGDTLVAVMLNYKTDTLVYNQQDYLIIQLKQISKMLKEVVVNDTLSNPLKVYDQNKKEYSDIYWKGDKSKMVSVSVGTMPGVGLNIDKLYSALSKQGHDARRLQRDFAQDYRTSIVDQRFNKTMVSKVTGYKGQKLDDFIVKYKPSYDYVIKATDYDLVQYIKRKMATDSNTTASL